MQVGASAAVLLTALAMVLQVALRSRTVRRGVDALAHHSRTQAFAGLILMAAAFLVFVLGGETQLQPRLPLRACLPTVGLVGLILIATRVASRRPAFQARYPEAPTQSWTAASWRANALAWVSYLVGYEMLFRGACLPACVAAFGRDAGLSVHVALYVLAHLHKNTFESLGSFPMGLLFGSLALWTESWVAPLIVHLSMALSTDLFAATWPRRGGPS